MSPEGLVSEVSGSKFTVKPDGPVREKSGHMSICTGITQREIIIRSFLIVLYNFVSLIHVMPS